MPPADPAAPSDPDPPLQADDREQPDARGLQDADGQQDGQRTPRMPGRVRAAIGAPLAEGASLDGADPDNSTGGTRGALLGLTLLLGLACGLAGWAGLALADLAGGAAPILPASGIAVAGLLAGGLRLWPAVFLAEICVAVLSALADGQNPATVGTLAIAGGNFLGPMIGVALLRAGLATGESPLDRPFGALQTLLLGVVLPALVSAAVGTGGLVVEQVLAPDALPRAVWTWWRADAVGILVLAVPILAVTAALARGRARRSAASDGTSRTGAAIANTVEPRDTGTAAVEGFGALVLAALLLTIGFTPWLPGAPPDLTFLAAAPVVWAALRLSQATACLLAFAVCAAVTAASVLGYGPFVRLDGALLALPLQAFLMLVMALALLLSAGRRLRARSEAETDALVAHLRAAKDRAERTVAQRDRAIIRLRNTLEETRVETVAGEDLQAGFLGAVARELTAAATALRAAIDRVMRVQPNNRPMPEGLTAASQAADVLGALSSDVGDVAAMEADTLRPDPSPVDLADLVEDVAARLAERRPGRTVCFVDPAMPVQLLADSMRLRQILATAADAALRLSDRDPVTLRALMEEGRPGETVVRLEVLTPTLFPDAGGPRPMTLDAFLETAGATPVGSGRATLSLWLARRLAEIMGGEADLRSWPEQGSAVSFRLTLPRARTGEADGPLSQAPDLPDFSPVRLLIAEGNAAQAEMLARYLNARGAQVETVTDAARGVDRLRLGERHNDGGGPGIDVVLIDATLRLAHGRTLLDRLMDGIPPGVRIVALRPPGDPTWRPPGKPGVVTATLDRPVRRGALYAAVAKAAGLDRIRPGPQHNGYTSRPDAAGASEAKPAPTRRPPGPDAMPGSRTATVEPVAEHDPPEPDAARTEASPPQSAAGSNAPDWKPADTVAPLADPVAAAYLRGARSLFADMEAAAAKQDPRAVRAIARTLRENGEAVGAAAMAAAAMAVEAAAAEPDWPAVGDAFDRLRAALTAAEDTHS